MKLFALAVMLFGLATPALARQPDTYQVTGTVDEVSDDLVVIKKGTKATVHYRMTATSVESSPEKSSKGKK